MHRKIHKIESPLKGEVKLSGSKSISNRLLIIRALCSDFFELKGLALADDTQVLLDALSVDRDVYDVHHAGTSYRFLCSFLTLKPGSQVLTGSERMKERPIGPLVDALRKLGADISYLEKEGYPPLNIGTSNWVKQNEPLRIDATISSQFISSLLLMAPSLPEGLILQLEGELVSRPYLEMTLRLMEEFGVEHDWEGDIITIKPQSYKAKEYEVEADWSAASYYYALCALVPGSEILLSGLRPKSTQGDSYIQQMMKPLGVHTEYINGVFKLSHFGQADNHTELDFLLQPDLAQTLSITCAGLGTTALFTGLQTLKVKETDRIAALQNELMKIQVFLSKLPAKFSKNQKLEYYMQEGEAMAEDTPQFASYKDHRMAMSFACLASKFDVIIENEDVVSKSYPDFWKDLESIGVRTSLM